MCFFLDVSDVLLIRERLCFFQDTKDVMPTPPLTLAVQCFPPTNPQDVLFTSWTHPEFLGRKHHARTFTRPHTVR